MADVELTEKESREVDTILTFLSAYLPTVVKAALKKRNAHLRGERIKDGWTIYTGEWPPASGQWMKLGNVTYTRGMPIPPEYSAAPVSAASRSTGNGTKTDLSMKPTDCKCPACGEVMAWEPICPGCALGKMGFSGRYVCMDDMTHEFYVTKPGVELPNH